MQSLRGDCTLAQRQKFNAVAVIDCCCFINKVSLVLKMEEIGFPILTFLLAQTLAMCNPYLT